MAAVTHLWPGLTRIAEGIVPLCDLHHFGSHGGTATPPDPHLEALFIGVFVAVLFSLGILLLGSPLLILWTRRIRSLFWIVPGSNLVLCLLGAALRAYPGGFRARFQPPGLWYTLGEILIILILSLIVAVIIAAVKWIFRKLRSLFVAKDAGPAQHPAAVPSHGQSASGN